MKYYVIFQRTALHIATAAGNLEIVELLLASPRVDVNLICIVISNFFFFNSVLYLTFVFRFY